MSNTHSDGAERFSELLEAIGTAVFEALPDDFSTATIRADAVNFSVQFRCGYRTESGEQGYVETPDELYDLVLRLRSEMYERDKGTWFSMTLDLDADGNVEVNFDYDHRPDIMGVSEESWAEDLQRFPRSPELVPSWYPRPS